MSLSRIDGLFCEDDTIMVKRKKIRMMGSFRKKIHASNNGDDGDGDAVRFLHGIRTPLPIDDRERERGKWREREKEKERVT